MNPPRTNEQKLPAGVFGLTLATDGGRAYAACADGFVSEVPHDGKPEAFTMGHDAYASGWVLLPDGKTLISAG